jgi:hypothetical protein
LRDVDLRRIAGAACAALAFCLAAPPQAGAQAPATAAVGAPAMLSMVRGALAALDQADKTGNYTVLRDLGGASFRQNTDARLAEVFAPLRSQALDLSTALAIDPVFTQPPRIEATGLLRVAGYFPGQPRLVFEIAWQKEAGAWKLYGVVVTASTEGGSPAARP